MSYLRLIPYGHWNPQPRLDSPGPDRHMREEIEEANKNGDCIINMGEGYYRPVPWENVDTKEFKAYIKREKVRARAILDKLEMMEFSFYNQARERKRKEREKESGCQQLSLFDHGAELTGGGETGRMDKTTQENA